MNNLGMYMAGYAILLIGLAAGAYKLGVDPTWIGVGALILVGVGVMAAAGYSRTPDGRL